MSRELDALLRLGVEPSPRLRAWMAVENVDRPPIIDQDGFRWRNDDGSETAATWVAAANTNIDSEKGANRVWRLRALLNQSVTNANFDLTQAFRLRYSLNSGAYVNVPAQGTGSVPVRYFNSTNLTHQAATTEQLGGVNVFRAGSIDEQGATAALTWATGAREDSEMEFVIEIVDAEVTATDTLDFRVYHDDGAAMNAYTVTPRLTVTAASANVSVTPATEALSVTGLAPSVAVSDNVSVQPATEVLAVTGLAPSVVLNARPSTPSIVSVTAAGDESTAITGITLGSPTTVRADGSDNWPMTWAEDDDQYTSFGDGGGFGGTNTDGRVSMGFARVEGAYPGTGVNVNGGKTPESGNTTWPDGGTGGKSTSMICISGNLYAFVSPGSNTGEWQYKRIWKSTDKGATWTEFTGSEWTGGNGEPGSPVFIQYGQNYGANADGYVYALSIEIQNSTLWDVQKPGVAWLARAAVAGEAFLTFSNWEWLTAVDGSNTPTWGAKASRITVPGLSDADGYMRGSAIYIPALNRYVYIQNYGSTLHPTAGIVVYEAPKPWGPWTQIHKVAPVVINSVDVNFRFASIWPREQALVSGNVEAYMNFFQPDQWNSIPITLTTT